MEYDLIIARSVTFAQRMQKALEQAGIRCRIFRAPRDLTDLGCAYAVQIPRAEAQKHRRKPPLKQQPRRKARRRLLQSNP